MHQETRRTTEWRATFGPFTLSPAERLLERNGTPVRLGGRALDLLIALVEAAGKIVSKKDLIARVWPDVVVEEGSLRFHMVAIRKVLGQGEGGSRYIVNTANKGYTFVAAVERRELDAAPIRSASLGTVSRSLPALTTSIVGRDDDVEAVAASLLQRRFVSVVGSNGIGKTTVAIATAQAAAKSFGGDVHFVDLSAISDAELVRSSVASAVGLQNRMDNLTALSTHLAERKALLVLDCCEHVVTVAAELAEVLVRACPEVHILATSSEPLRAKGEFVYRLQPLAFPADGEGTTAADALAYPAVKLFVDRAAASGSGFELRDADAPLTSQLCRELAGNALAIELAAGRIEALGLKAITSQFDASIKLMWQGWRTAVPRHQTLGATLEWSFRLLSDDEKRLLRRLSVFAGNFSLDAAIDVCGFDFDKSIAIELVASLVSKSLMTVDAGGAALRYGLLDTTKSFCLKKLCDSGEDAAMSQRFASYFGVWAQQYVTQNMGADVPELVALDLANLLASLEWHFRINGQSADALTLAVLSCPLLLQLSKIAECTRWAQAALSQMPASFKGSYFEMRLQAVLGQSLLLSKGGSFEAAAAFRRSIEVAEQLGDPRSTLHLLNGYSVLQHREGLFADALVTARKAQSLLSEVGDAESRAIVDSLMGVALHLVGEVPQALQHWERCFSYTSAASSGTRLELGFDYHVRALCGSARCLWLMGHYARGISVAQETIEKARKSGHVMTYCITLFWAGSVYFWARDALRLSGVVDEIELVAKRHSLVLYLALARVARGQLMIVQGRSAEVIDPVQGALEFLQECRYERVTSVAKIVLARGYSDASMHAAALAMCDEAERLIQTCGYLLRMPELLSTRGYCLAAAGQAQEAEKSYRAAIRIAHSQGVKSFQVQAAVLLARLLISAGRAEDAHRLLRPHVVDADDETSLDLSLARSLLGGQQGTNSPAQGKDMATASL